MTARRWRFLLALRRRSQVAVWHGRKRHSDLRCLLCAGDSAASRERCDLCHQTKFTLRASCFVLLSSPSPFPYPLLVDLPSGMLATVIYIYIREVENACASRKTVGFFEVRASRKINSSACTRTRETVENLSSFKTSRVFFFG